MRLNIETQQSIDALMGELKEVVSIARKTDDPVDILEYLMAELPAVFKEDRDVVLRRLQEGVC